MTPFFLVSLVGLLVSKGLSLEVTPGSSCATFCLDDGLNDAFDSEASSTNTTDIVCQDLDFSTKDAGIKFKSCVECLQKSDKVNKTESDVYWYLYNIRYAISTCLFSVPNELPNQSTDSPCVIEHACRPLEKPLTADKLDPEKEAYGYCSASGGSFMGQNLEPCISCLQASSDQIYLSNFMVALEAGCQQKPAAGTPISLSGSVFAKSAVNITEPEEDIRSKPGGASSTTLTTGTIVGIAVGAGLLLFGGVALFIVHWRRQKKLDKEEQMSTFRTYGSTPDPFLPPPGGKMSDSLRSYSEQGYHNDGHYKSSGDYYDKMEDDVRAGRLNYNFDPRSKSRGPNSALPAHQAYIPQAMSRIVADAAAADGASSRPSISSHRHTGSNSSGSYAAGSVQPPPAAVHPDPSGRGTPTLSRPVPPPPPGPPAAQRNIPSLVLPAVNKLRMPKKYSPPMLVTGDAAPAGERSDHEIQISQPVIRSTSRFQDLPLAGGVVYATDAKAVEQSHQFEGYGEIPMRSGKSLLYG